MKTEISIRKKLKLLLVMTFTAGMIFVTAVGMIFLLYMKDTVKASGMVKSVERAEIVSPANGLLAKIHKKEGDSVYKGELLLEIKSEELSDKLLKIKGELAEEEALLEVARCKLALIKQNPLPEKLWHVASETKLNLARRAKSEKDLKRARKLFDRKIIAEKSFQQAELEYAKTCMEYKKCCKLKKLIENGLADNIIKNSESEVNLVETRIKILQKQRNTIKEKITSCRIVAPHKGVVLSIPETTGLYAEQNTPLIRIVWGEKKFIRAKIHEKSIQDVKKDQYVICYSAHYDRFRTGAFKGKVLRILSEVNNNNEGRFYEVDITLLEEPKTLRLGSTVDVQIVTGRKTIFHAMTKN